MRVLLFRGCDEDVVWDLVVMNGIDDEFVVIDFFVYECVYFWFCCDCEIEGDGVVFVRTLYVLRRNRV